jgi:hypothetical protein
MIIMTLSFFNNNCRFGHVQILKVLVKNATTKNTKVEERRKKMVKLGMQEVQWLKVMFKELKTKGLQEKQNFKPQWKKCQEDGLRSIPSPR